MNIRAGRIESLLVSIPIGVVVLPAYAALGPYADETPARMTFPNVIPTLTTADTEEKDYAWGDVDQDGDIDLVVVRKQPWTTTGKRVNVLLMNEGVGDGHAIDGVFVDRTAEFAQASDIEGDLGFNTPTNDRDVVLVDVDNDGWLDIVTSTTLTDNQAKHISHPRVYMNLGEQNGAWLGFEYQDARIPLMHPTAGPRFCAVDAGDVTGDGTLISISAITTAAARRFSTSTTACSSTRAA